MYLFSIGRRHEHEHKHKNLKKDEVVVTVIDTVYAQPSEVPEVIVYVNQFGDPVSTTTELIHISPSIWSTAYASSSSISTSAPVYSASSSYVAAPAPVETYPVDTPVVSPTYVAAPPPASTSPVDVPPPVVPSNTYSAAPAPISPTPPPAQSSTPVTSEGSDYGVSYSPYNSDNSCKTQDQVNQDFKVVGPAGYSLVRTYGVDCNQVSTVLNAAKAYNMKLFAGIYDLSSLNSDVGKIVAAANGDWSSFDTISVGNELVNSGSASPAQVVAAIGTVRGLLKSAGYTGKVVTVDTLVAARANPSICDASDYAAVNSHPFYDGNTVAADSGSFLTTQIPTLSAVLANKNQQIVITETGWPWKGQSNGVAVPSLENQAAALTSIKTAFSSNKNSVILFTAFNDLWKTNSPAQFQAEQYWGMGGVNSPSG